MGKNHLKRYCVPNTWGNIGKKEEKYIVKPSPGPHSIRISLPLILWMKKLSLINTRREAKKILHQKNVLVDSKRVKAPDYPVGFMDVLSFPDIKKQFRVVFNNLGRLELKEILKSSPLKPCKVIGKKMVRGKLQVNFYDGKNILNADKNLKIGDSVVLELSSLKVHKIMKLDKDATISLIGGKHIGDNGVAVEFKGEKIIYDNQGKKVETLKEYAYVTGEEFTI